MRWNAGRHADRDSGRAVDQKVRKFRRQDNRLGAALIVSRRKVDRVVLQIREHVGRGRRESRLCVSHGGGRQTGERTEVALLVDHRLSHHPVLSHADERGINRPFAVRVIVTAGVAADFRALHPVRVRTEVQIAHRDQDAPLRRLQTVAGIRESSRHDDRHGVLHVRVGHFLSNIVLLDAFLRRSNVSRFTVSNGQCRVSLRGSTLHKQLCNNGDGAGSCL